MLRIKVNEGKSFKALCMDPCCTQYNSMFLAKLYRICKLCREKSIFISIVILLENGKIAKIGCKFFCFFLHLKSRNRLFLLLTCDTNGLPVCVRVLVVVFFFPLIVIPNSSEPFYQICISCSSLALAEINIESIKVTGEDGKFEQS